MTSFKKLNTKTFQQRPIEYSADYIYWKKLGAHVLVREFGPIDYIDFSPIEPYFFAVTCSVRVQVYNPITKLVAKNLSRFRENAYGASFRSDGRLLCAGGEEQNVKLFDVSSKSLLRLFKGHTAPVHRTFFVTNEPKIASFSDDRSVKIWDIATEKNTISFAEHDDYIRAGCTNPVVPDIILSGGYDNIVKMYDTRTNQSVLSVDHKSPVESLLYLPSGGIFLSAGGTEIKIWDTIAGGKLIGSLSQHHKTITCLRLASNNKRLMSGSLDRHVKIYDLSTFKVVHTLDYPNSVLSLGVSRDDETVVAGLVNGLVAINRREDYTKVEEKKTVSFQHKPQTHQRVDLVVEDVKSEKETTYDKCLRKFEYSKALDAVLLTYVANKNPQITVAMIQELIKRKALQRVIQNRDVTHLIKLLKFILRNIVDKSFMKVLISASNIVLDALGQCDSLINSEVKVYLMKLKSLLRDQEEVEREMALLQGAMHMLLAASTITEPVKPQQMNLTPSKDAEKNLIVNLT